MSYLHDRNKDRKRKQFLIGLGMAVVLVVLSLLGTFRGLGGFLQTIGRPLWKGEKTVAVTIDQSSYLVRSKSAIFRENTDLKNRNSELESAMLDYTLLKKENEDLKALLGRIPETKTFTLASVLTKPNRSPYDTIVIDIGSDHNLYEGQIIYAQAEFPIGRITKVYANTALITLYSSPGETIEAQVEGTNTSVQLTGRGGGNFEMTVPHDLVVPTGTFVVAPSIQSHILAIVADVVSDIHDPMAKIILKSPVNIQELKWVQVLKN